MTVTISVIAKPPRYRAYYRNHVWYVCRDWGDWTRIPVVAAWTLPDVLAELRKYLEENNG